MLTRGWEDRLVEQAEILEGTGLTRAGLHACTEAHAAPEPAVPEELREEVRALLWE